MFDESGFRSRGGAPGAEYSRARLPGHGGVISTKAKAEKVSGYGDEAIWAPKLGSLLVRKGDVTLTFHNGPLGSGGTLEGQEGRRRLPAAR